MVKELMRQQQASSDALQEEQRRAETLLQTVQHKHELRLADYRQHITDLEVALVILNW